MEKLFERSVSDASKLMKLTDDDYALFQRVDQACDELLIPEFEKYMERKFNDKVPQILKKHRLMGVPISKKYGGDGARPLVLSLALERFGQLGLGVVTFVDVHEALGSQTIQEWGNEEQKQRYLTKAATGEIVLAYALTEPEAGSDPASLKTQFRKDGSNYYLTGSKYLISNGSIADRLIVFAYPEGQTKGMTAFLVDAKEHGFSVDMKLEEKMGLFTSDTAMLSFSDLRVAREDVLGEEGRGLAVAYSALLNGRIGIASGSLGVMEDCLNQVKERVSSRTQHGKPIGKHQLVQRHVARIAANLESSRWLVYQAAIKKDEYDNNKSDLSLRMEADRISAVAKYVATKAAWESADSAVQCFGGFGYSILSPVAKHLIDSRVARIYEGTDEVMELKIASTVLGKDFEAYR
ncbi:MAG: acyl-CoA dehydrogenase family protein [Thaumarchaeota archaeon]|nr:acyl-CoA dehydrogenase family protein [Nitrososphaerota archaeon]MDA4135452.1 acyl-CoA dehydrogenase family protein [Nitrososphaerota archaeon]